MEHRNNFLHKIHFDPTISITHLLTTFSIALGVVLWGMGISERITVLEVRQSDQTARIINVLENQRLIDARQDAEVAETKRTMREDLRDINTKLDNILRTATATAIRGNQ